MKQSLAFRGATLMVLAAGSFASAQHQAEEPSTSPQLLEHLRSFQAQAGPNWRLHNERETGYAKMVFGGKFQAPFSPARDEDYYALVEGYVAMAQPLLGAEVATLEADRVKLLPLASIGTTDKMAVRFRQVWNEVPVHNGYLDAILAMDGSLLALHHTGLPHLTSFDTTAHTTAAQATAFAVQAFEAETYMEAARISDAELVIFQEKVGKVRVGTLAWMVDVLNTEEGEPRGYTYAVAAQGPARVIDAANLIHHFDVGGTVTGLTTPGLDPDSGSNPPTARPMRYMTVTSSAGNTTTDVNGNFTITGTDGPIDVTFTFEGTYNDVNNVNGPEYSLTVSLTGTGNSVLMNPTPTQDITAEANAFFRINQLRDWVRSVDPSDSNADFVADSNVNLSSTCNAFFDGGSTNYFLAGGGCVNTAYSTVVAHEMGHWFNNIYGTFNGSDGMGEGNADVWAMYSLESPVVGADFCGNNCNIRTGLNTRQYCGDGNGGCYGQVHADGEVWMGAAWKVRANLMSTHGTTAGGDIADGLFLGWMNGFNQTQIDSIIEEQWLTLDDDDGNINNGTPNYADIDAGFTAQGFPGFELSFVEFANVVQLDDTLDEEGPFGVSAEITPVFGSSVTSASLFYREGNSGPYTEVPMSVHAGDTWKAEIPGLASPTTVNYYIEGTDDAANSNRFPDEGTLGYTVGIETLFFTENFETAGDNGWTHAQVATQDDWMHDTPRGSNGTSSGVGWADPASAVSGSQVWGNDLGPAGWNGAYQPNVVNYLRSPFIDLSSAAGTKLVFQRWLTVEEGIFDDSEIFVNGSLVWSNPDNGHLIDTSWTQFEVDISAEADGNPSTQIEWRLESDGGLQLGGWNIDDVELKSLDASPTDCLPSQYGTGLAGTFGIPTISSAGQPANIGNNSYEIAVKNALPEATVHIVLGDTMAVIPFKGGNVLVNPLIINSFSADIFGQVHMMEMVPNDPVLVGQSFFLQALVRDDGGFSGPFAFTSGMQVTVCN